MIKLIYRITRKIQRIVHLRYCSVVTYFRLKGNGVHYGKNFLSKGCPVIDVWEGGRFSIGDDVALNNGNKYNIIGRQQPCYFTVRKGAALTIGDNTGLSGVAIVCSTKITIGNSVKIGGNTVIYDTDFHSQDAKQRSNLATDLENTKNAPVEIGDHVFIGAHSTILKGVSIGSNSIVGSGSVVAKSIPPNEIWAGNPAKFIKAVLPVDQIFSKLTFEKIS